MTQTKWPPAKPERFTRPSDRSLSSQNIIGFKLMVPSNASSKAVWQKFKLRRHPKNDKRLTTRGEKTIWPYRAIADADAFAARPGRSSVT